MITFIVLCIVFIRKYKNKYIFFTILKCRKYLIVSVSSYVSKENDITVQKVLIFHKPLYFAICHVTLVQFILMLSDELMALNFKKNFA